MSMAQIAKLLFVGCLLSGTGVCKGTDYELRPRHRSPVELIIDSPVVALGKVVDAQLYSVSVEAIVYVIGGNDLPQELELQAIGYQTEMVPFRLEAGDLILLGLTPEAELFDPYSLDSYIRLNGQRHFTEFAQALRALHDDDAENDQQASSDLHSLVERFTELDTADRLLALWMIIEEEIAIGEQDLQSLIRQSLLAEDDSVVWLGTVLIGRNSFENQFVNELIQGLESESWQVRSASVSALAKLRDGDRGMFDFRRPPEEQQEAIRSWRAWAIEYQRLHD